MDRGLCQPLCLARPARHQHHPVGARPAAGAAGRGSDSTRDSTFWRTGASGMAWSTRCAAAFAIRRAPHGRLQLQAAKPLPFAPGGPAWSPRGDVARSGPGAPSGARRGCRPMACMRGSQGCDPGRSQAARRRSLCGPPTCGPTLCCHLLVTTSGAEEMRCQEAARRQRQEMADKSPTKPDQHFRREVRSAADQDQWKSCSS